MRRRTVLQSGVLLATAGLAGCLSESDITVTDESSSAEMGVITVSATVKNTADGTRRGTVVAEVDITGGSTTLENKEVELASGETRDVEFTFMPSVSGETTYGYDVSVKHVYDPTRTDLPTVTATDDQLGVEVTVTYPPDSDPEPPRLEETDYEPIYENAAGLETVTPFVNFTMTGKARDAAVTFEYDDTDVSDGEESNLTILQFKRQSKEFVEVSDVTVDTEANTVRGTIAHDGIVDVVVIHRRG